MIWLVIACVIYYLLAGLTVGVGYHRVLTHRSAVLPKWLERSIVTIGLPAGTPIKFVGNHRYHHYYADRKQDPHSPVVDGFWFAHVGWYMNTKNIFICVLYCLAGPLRMVID